MKNTVENARAWLASLTEEQFVLAWNEHVMSDKTTSDFIYRFDDPDEFFNREFSTPSEATRAVMMGNVSYNDNWITFNGVGNLVSISDVFDYVDIDELAQAVSNDPISYGFDNVLDEGEEVTIPLF